MTYRVTTPAGDETHEAVSHQVDDSGTLGLFNQEGQMVASWVEGMWTHVEELAEEALHTLHSDSGEATQAGEAATEAHAHQGASEHEAGTTEGGEAATEATATGDVGHQDTHQEIDPTGATAEQEAKGPHSLD